MHSNGVRAELVSGCDGWSCMMLLQPAQTCTNAAWSWSLHLAPSPLHLVLVVFLFHQSQQTPTWLAHEVVVTKCNFPQPLVYIHHLCTCGGFTYCNLFWWYFMYILCKLHNTIACNVKLHNTIACNVIMLYHTALKLDWNPTDTTQLDCNDCYLHTVSVAQTHVQLL